MNDPTRLDLGAIRDGLEKDRVTAVVPPRPKDAQIIADLLDEVAGLRRESEDHRLAMVESDRQRDKARGEVGRLRDGIRQIAAARCLCEPPHRNHGGPCCTAGSCVTCQARKLLDDREETR